MSLCFEGDQELRVFGEFHEIFGCSGKTDRISLIPLIDKPPSFERMVEFPANK